MKCAGDNSAVETSIMELESETRQLSDSFMDIDQDNTDSCSSEPVFQWDIYFNHVSPTSVSSETQPVDDHVMIDFEDSYTLCTQEGCKQPCVIENGFYVCKMCGTIGDQCIDSTAEWRTFGNEDSKSADPSRCGHTNNNTYLLPTETAGTMISSKWKESDQMKNARQVHRWSSSNSRGRTLIAIFNELQRIAYENGYSRMIIEDTKHLYKTTTEYHMFRGQNRKGLYAYCLFHTCKLHGVPRSIKEICELFNVSEQTLTKGHSAFNKVLKERDTMAVRKQNEKNQLDNKDATKTIKTGRRRRKCDRGSKLDMLEKPSDFVDRFCSRLSLSADICEDVHSVVQKIKEKGLSTDNPSLITAASIHMVLKHRGLPSTTSKIHAISNHSHVTIDKCYKSIIDYKDELL